MFRDGFLLHTYKDGQAKLLGYLDDYAFLAVGLLDIYETLLDRAFLDRALQLNEIMLREFWDEEEGGFFIPASRRSNLSAGQNRSLTRRFPSGNAMATQLLLRLHHITGQEDYRARAEKVLRSYYDVMENQPFGFAHMLCAVDQYLDPPKEIVVVGNADDPRTKALLAEVHRIYLPNKVLQLVGAEQALEDILAASARKNSG